MTTKKTTRPKAKDTETKGRCSFTCVQGKKKRSQESNESFGKGNGPTLWEKWAERDGGIP